MSETQNRVVVFAGSTIEADLVRLHLQESGIDARLHNEHVGTWAPYLAASGGVGAVEVSVPSANAAEASELIRRRRERPSSE